MSLKNLVENMKSLVETASIEEYLDTSNDPVTSRLVFEVTRANAILDKNKSRIFVSHLNIKNRTDAEKASIAYSNEYFLGLPLSLETVAELVQAIKDSCIAFKASPPRSWDDIINGLHSTENLTEDEKSEEDGSRFKPSI